MDKKVLFVGETDSTNSYLKRYPAKDEAPMIVAVSDYQTAGRGQGTNTWESERGKNLLFSILVHPESIPAHSQFVLSMADALAQKKALDQYTGGITLKWPNDVYWKDRKISGTLIETSLSGQQIRHCIIGTGMNINQSEFRGSAPNPVSLRQILGRDTDPIEVLHKTLSAFAHYYTMALAGRNEEIRTEYLRSLYRRQGMHPYEDSHSRFLAETVTVEPSGRLVLRRDDGQTSTYAFKEVKFLTNH